MDITVTLSVLDPLMMDESGRNRTHQLPEGEQALRLLKLYVQRDLEALLNTRRGVNPGLDPTTTGRRGATSSLDTHRDVLNRSMLSFGLPDFSTERSPEKIAMTIEDAIRKFEPRLEAVRVTPDNRAEGNDRRASVQISASMKFRIHARLKVEPIPLPVEYDTVMEVTSGRAVVTGGKGSE